MPMATREARARARASPHRTGGAFLAALAMITLLAAGTGLALAWLVHEPRRPGTPERTGRDACAPCAYSPGTNLYRLEPVVANLRHPQEAFVRVDLALVIEEPDEAARTASGRGDRIGHDGLSAHPRSGAARRWQAASNSCVKT